MLDQAGEHRSASVYDVGVIAMTPPHRLVFSHLIQWAFDSPSRLRKSPSAGLVVWLETAISPLYGAKSPNVTRGVGRAAVSSPRASHGARCTNSSPGRGGDPMKSPFP